VDVTGLDADPLRQLSAWLDAARAAGRKPNCQTCSTSNHRPGGRSHAPSTQIWPTAVLIIIEATPTPNGGSVRVLPDLVHHPASPSIDIDSAARPCLKVVVGQLPVDAAIERCGRGKISPDLDAP
jgi:hypothetical protein